MDLTNSSLIKQYKLGPHSYKWSDEIFHKLLDKEWLMDMHVHQLFSIVELSKIIGVTPHTVKKFLIIHGIDTPTQQSLREASNLRKYGTQNVGSISSIRQKALTTMENLYGGHNWNINNRQTRDNTCLVKYGNANVGKTEYAKKQALQTNLLKYGRFHKNQQHILVDTLLKLKDKDWLYDQHIVQQKSLLQISTELGFCDNTPTNTGQMSKAFKFYNLPVLHFQRSYEEQLLVNYIKTICPTINIILNDRSLIYPHELDIYLPDYNIAIEYCGLYWHTEAAGKSSFYHNTKWKQCKDIGIQLLTIYSDEWLKTPSIVKTKISQLLGMNQSTKIFARKCNIGTPLLDDKKIFLNNYHIQGTGSGSISYSLYYNDNMVACMVFKETGIPNEWYLNRYATSNIVSGGFTRLLQYFKKHHSWSKIVTFADCRWSNGDLYINNNFVLDSVLKPDYYYVINNRRIHKFNFRRKYLPNLLETFNPEISEWENCKLHNITRIWDCGKLRFTLTPVYNSA